MFRALGLVIKEVQTDSDCPSPVLGLWVVTHQQTPVSPGWGHSFRDVLEHWKERRKQYAFWVQDVLAFHLSVQRSDPGPSPGRASTVPSTSWLMFRAERESSNLRCLPYGSSAHASIIQESDLARNYIIAYFEKTHTPVHLSHDRKLNYVLCSI